MKQTQLNSYILIKEVVSERHLQILNLLNDGCYTSKEIGIRLNLPINCVSGRLTELEKMNKLDTSETVFDLSTKRRVTKYKLK